MANTKTRFIPLFIPRVSLVNHTSVVIYALTLVKFCDLLDICSSLYFQHISMLNFKGILQLDFMSTFSGSQLLLQNADLALARRQEGAQTALFKAFLDLTSKILQIKLHTFLILQVMFLQLHAYVKFSL